MTSQCQPLLDVVHKINWLAATFSVRMRGVRGRVFHELEVLLNALTLYSRASETLIHSSFTHVEKVELDR